MKHGVSALVCLCLLAGSILSGRADDIAQTGRDIAAKWQQTVVTVQVVGKTHTVLLGHDNAQDMKSEVNAVVIDPNGLLVSANSAIDPMGLMDAILPETKVGGMNIKMSMSLEVTGVTIILPDGTAIPAQIVMRDKDLDLVFIRPRAKLEKPLEALDLQKPAAPGLLDTVFLMGRLGADAGYAVTMVTDRVRSVLEQPRRLYVLNTQVMIAGTGLPVFTGFDQFVGICTQRIPDKGAAQGLFGAVGSFMVTVVPAADIAAAAANAPMEAPPPPPKPEPVPTP